MPTVWVKKPMLWVKLPIPVTVYAQVLQFVYRHKKTGDNAPVIEPTKIHYGLVGGVIGVP